MARQRGSIPIHETLRNLFPDGWVEAEARRLGVLQRQRKLSSTVFFWTLLLGFGTGRQRTLAGLRRAFNQVSGASLSPSSFYKRFTPAVAQWMRAALERAFQAEPPASGRLEGVFSRFRDVILVDATLVRLQDALQDVYPGHRTSKANIRLHTVFSVRGVGRRSVQLSCGRSKELRNLVVGPWVRGHVLVLDLGYFAYELFARIQDEQGFFLCRLKRHVNLPVLNAHRGVDGTRASLREVIARTRGDQLDVWVEMPTLRTPSGRWRARGRRPMRVVGRRAPTGRWHLYMTNVPPERLGVEDVAQLYAARWEIELLFKEVKSHYGLTELPSRKREIVEALLYAALLTLLTSRRLAMVVREQVCVSEDRVRTQRWARLFRSIADDVLRIVVEPERKALSNEHRLTPVILREAVDPNAARDSLLRQIERGAHTYQQIALTSRNGDAFPA